MKPALSSLFLILVFTPCSHATLNRGVWFWGDTGSPYGSKFIVGNSVHEDSTITFLSAQGVKRVYGSYQNRPVAEPGTIKGWNAKLHAAGIESQCLFSDNHRIFPSLRGALLDKIEERVIFFNDPPGAAPPIPIAQRFDAVHLDLEPQALDGDAADAGYDWSAQTAANKRDWLLHLRDTYADIRALLVSHGLPDYPVYADLPVWFDKLPVDGGQVGWIDVADRDQWYTDIMTSLTGVSFMPFEQTNNSAILASMSTEHTLIDPARIRIGHMCDVGATWPTYELWKLMRYWMEWYYGSRAVDIQSYRRWREALLGPFLPAVSITFELTASGLGGDMVLHPGGKGSFVLLQSTNFCQWQEVSRFDLEQPRAVRIPFSVTGPRKFWQVLQISNPAPVQR